MQRMPDHPTSALHLRLHQSSYARVRTVVLGASAQEQMWGLKPSALRQGPPVAQGAVAVVMPVLPQKAEWTSPSLEAEPKSESPQQERPGCHLRTAIQPGACGRSRRPETSGMDGHARPSRHRSVLHRAHRYRSP